ncbi:unnamed protein product [Soboliphyme baturini]|uniref:Neur_chan_LBD domain-containing protein n=1 Tax=Soboliphyme baturini TaxID=241478 RepID=A0A183ID90_9BILA|nr:unnamed protein product [Soboliphyme baturini]
MISVIDREQDGDSPNYADLGIGTVTRERSYGIGSCPVTLLVSVRRRFNDLFCSGKLPFLLLFQVCHAFSYELSRNITHILNTLVDKKYYDKRLRPNYGGPAVDVGITLHVSSISAVSEVDMDYTLDFYLRQNWVDPRLDIRRLGAQQQLTVGWEYTKDIWVPDTFFPNEKKSFFHQATTHNSFLRIKGMGEILTSHR